jgi:hypothetical protein
MHGVFVNYNCGVLVNYNFGQDSPGLTPRLNPPAR